MTTPDSRDRLAAERTHPADERPLLAHLRAELVLCAGGAASLDVLRSLGSTLAGWLPLALEFAALPGQASETGATGCVDQGVGQRVFVSERPPVVSS